MELPINGQHSAVRAPGCIADKSKSYVAAIFGCVAARHMTDSSH